MGRGSWGGGCGVATNCSPSKSPKLIIIYQWNFFTELCILWLHCLLFSCLDCVTWCAMAPFLWTLSANYVNYTYNSTCLAKIIWNCLHWCNLYILSQSLLYLKQKNRKINSKFNFCWENLDIDQLNTIFQISEKVRANVPLTPKYKIFEENFF